MRDSGDGSESMGLKAWKGPFAMSKSSMRLRMDDKEIKFKRLKKLER